MIQVAKVSRLSVGGVREVTLAEFQSLRVEAVEGLDGEPGGDLVQGGSVASLQGSFYTREELHR